MSLERANLEVVAYDARYQDIFANELRKPKIRHALGLSRQPSSVELEDGTAVTVFGDASESQKVHWWVILESNRATWGAIEYGWRGPLDVTRELDLFRVGEAFDPRSDIVWAMWCLARVVFARKPMRRIRWQVRKGDGKSNIYRRLSFHELGESSFEGEIRDVFELSRRRFERVEDYLGTRKGRFELLRALRIT